MREPAGLLPGYGRHGEAKDLGLRRGASFPSLNRGAALDRLDNRADELGDRGRTDASLSHGNLPRVWCRAPATSTSGMTGNRNRIPPPAFFSYFSLLYFFPPGPRAAVSNVPRERPDWGISSLFRGFELDLGRDTEGWLGGEAPGRRAIRRTDSRSAEPSWTLGSARVLVHARRARTSVWATRRTEALRAGTPRGHGGAGARHSRGSSFAPSLRASREAVLARS